MLNLNYKHHPYKLKLQAVDDDSHNSKIFLVQVNNRREYQQIPSVD